jgi:hypothetical protein
VGGVVVVGGTVTGVVVASVAGGIDAEGPLVTDVMVVVDVADFFFAVAAPMLLRMISRTTIPTMAHGHRFRFSGGPFPDLGGIV